MITTDSIKTAATKIAQLMEESADELNAADGLLVTEILESPWSGVFVKSLR